jgi:MFS transporter, DHA1 family, multidrug resistance protein
MGRSKEFLVIQNQTINRSHTLLIIILGFLNALTPFTIDLYLPAFSDIAVDLGTTVPKVSLSVATYFVGFAIGQILWGPLLDRFGRKNPIYFGLALYILASIGCMTAQSVEALWTFRFLAAIGGSATSVGSITMVRDYFDPKEGAKVFSMLMLVLSVSPMFAPTIGGWIAAFFGWRIIFGVLAALAAIDVSLVIFGLPVAYQPDKNVILRAGPILRNFREVFRIDAYRIYAISGSLSFSGLFVYLTGSPAIFMDGFGVSKQTFGIIFGILASGMIGGGQINNFLMRRYDSETILNRLLLLQVAISTLFLLTILFIDLPLIPTILFFFCLLTVIGISFPNAAALALQPITKNVGSASALMGFLQMSLGAALAAIVGIMEIKGMLPTVLVLCLSAVLGASVLILGQNKLKARASA